MTIRMQGHLAGLSYLGVVLSGIFALAYGPGQLIDFEDASVTLSNIEAQTGLFHGVIACGVIMNAFFVALLYWLSRLLSGHGPVLARLMAGLAMASIPFTLLAFYQYGGIATSIADGSATMETVADARASYRFWLSFSVFFWGAWLAPYGLLVFRSRIIPRWLGVMLMVGSVGYVLDLIGSLAIDNFYDIPIASYVTLPASIGEIGSCLWLTLLGARAPRKTGPTGPPDLAPGE